MIQLNKRAYAVFDNMVQLKRYYGSTKTPFLGDSFLGGGGKGSSSLQGSSLPYVKSSLLIVRASLSINFSAILCLILSSMRGGFAIAWFWWFGARVFWFFGFWPFTA
jgi:hypothetical protein